MMRNYIVVFFCAMLLVIDMSAQAIQHQTSYPVNIPFESVSKLVLLENGRTLLFSFKQNKDIRVKVFDKLHNEIADEKIASKNFNEHRLDKTDIKGVYGMNNEAVLFFGQNTGKKSCLIRLRIDTAGKVCGEELISDICLEYWLVNDGKNNNYGILFLEDVITNPKNNITFVSYDNKHNKISETIVNFDASSLSGLSVVGAEKDFYGNICLMFNVWQKAVSGEEKKLTKKSWLLLAYMPVHEDYFQYKLIPRGYDTIPEYFRYGYDVKNKRLDFFVVSRFETKDEDYVYTTFPSNIYSLDANTLDVLYETPTSYYIDFSLLDKEIAKRPRNYIPVHISVDEEGVISVIAETIASSTKSHSRSHATYRTKETRGGWEYLIQHYWSESRVSGSTLLGDINITKFDADGEIVGGHIIPKAHAINNSVRPFEIVNRKRDKELFTRNAMFEIVNQYVSFDYIRSQTGASYLLYNDNIENFDKELIIATDTVYDYQQSNAVCNIVSKSGMSKTNLLGKPQEDVAEACMVETSYFDYNSGIYVSLYSEKNKKNTAYKVAWVLLK